MKKNEVNDFNRYVESFKSFKNRHKLTNIQIAVIMTEYANAVDERGASFFADKYGLTEYEFYRIKDYTIVFMLVDSSTCLRIREKSYRNQSSKNPSGNFTSSSNHYKKLIALRREYLKTFSKNEIIRIAEEYAKNVPLYDISKKHQISVHTVQRLLAIALANHFVNPDVYQQINCRSTLYIHTLRNYKGYTVDNLWYNSY